MIKLTGLDVDIYRRSMPGVIILAPHALHREAWQALLANQPGITIAGAVAEPAQIPTLTPHDPRTTILVDLPTPQPEIARQIKALAPHIGLLFLVQSYELGIILPLLKAGATGCISRDDSVGDLDLAIIAVGRGEMALPPSVAVESLLALAKGQTDGEGLIEPLSEREAEVLRLLARGLTNKDIAQALILSVRTVEAHLRSIYAKLDVSSRTEAALWGVRHSYGL